ncbi:MAG: phosphate ABC transporter, permease protein PstA [Rickettsiales bacterium]|nr:phosphate ABC transporter, permease protein PstA [Rickettsiales bacterium]
MSEISKKIEKSLKKRHESEKNFKYFGLSGIIIAILFLVIILSSIFATGKKAFQSTYIEIEVFFDKKIIDPKNTRDTNVIKSANYLSIIKRSLQNYFPDVEKRRDLSSLTGLISSSEQENLAAIVSSNPNLIGEKVSLWLLASSTYDVINKNLDLLNLTEKNRLINDQELLWFKTLKENKKIKFKFNSKFFTSADSTEPEQAGITGSLMGSFLTLLITLILSFPIAVAAGVFLEELAPKNKFTDFIEVNINNLAAVPSIIFGLLGLAIFLNVMHLPRSAPIVGGMVLALMTLPTIIIATRASLKAVPPSIREAAIGLGATKMQTVTHHVLPLALPGILTGTIIGMSQALGESAPLLMIGMVAFIVDIPGSLFDSATVLPVQIYLWKSTAARGFVELTAAGVMVLLVFLILMNGLAVFIRKKFEKRW